MFNYILNDHFNNNNDGNNDDDENNDDHERARGRPPGGRSGAGKGIWRRTPGGGGFHAMAMGGPSGAPGMRALKTNACAGTEKPPAGLSEAPLGVSQRLSGAKNSTSFPWGAACGGHQYGCLGELGGRGQ